MGKRQEDLEACVHLGGGAQVERTFVGAHDVEDDGKTEAATNEFGAEERIEDPLQGGFGDADPLVLDRNQQPLLTWWGFLGGSDPGMRRKRVDHGSGDIKGAGFIDHGLDAVVDQIAEQLLKATEVAMDVPELGRDIKFDLKMIG